MDDARWQRKSRVNRSDNPSRRLTWRAMATSEEEKRKRSAANLNSQSNNGRAGRARGGRAVRRGDIEFKNTSGRLLMRANYGQNLQDDV